MKNTLITAITFSVILCSVRSFAFFAVVSAPGVEANQHKDFGYVALRDYKQEFREIKKLEDWVTQLGRMQTQINNLIELNNTAMDTYHKAERIVEVHGNWDNITAGNIAGVVSREADQKLHTTTSILNDINGAPEKVIDNSKFLQEFVKKVDTKNWIQEKETRKEKFEHQAVALKQYEVYEEYRKFAEGYKDETGEHEGRLEYLSRKLKDYKRKLDSSKTDTEVQFYLESIKQAEDEIRYIGEKEATLRERYESAVRIADQSRKVADVVSESSREESYDSTLSHHPACAVAQGGFELMNN
jgi:hypothetical protein